MKIKITGVIVFIFLLLKSASVYSSDFSKDTTLINKWVKISKEFIYTKPDSSRIYIDSILLKSQEIDYNKGLYIAYNHSGIVFYMKGQMEESIKNYTLALNYTNPNKPREKINTLTNISYSLRNLHLIDSALKINEKVIGLARKHQLSNTYQKAILDIAYAYMEKEDYVKAATFYHQVIEDTKTTADTHFLIQSYSSLAMFYYALEDFHTSKLYYNKAINLNYENTEFNYLSVNYANLGILYQHIKNDYDSAIYYYNKSLSYTQEFDRERKKLMVDINIGNCFLDQALYDSAYRYYDNASKNPIFKDDPLYQAAVFTNIGTYHLRKKHFKEAREFLIKGLKISDEINHLEFQQIAYKNLFKLDSIQQNHTSALNYFQKYFDISNRRNLEEVNHQIAILDYEKYLAQEKYNNDLLLKENHNQNQQIIIQRAVLAFVFILVLVLVIITILISRNRKKVKHLNANLKNSNKNLAQLNSELQVQKQEMKELIMSKDRFVSILGHDLKNPFTGLMGLLEMIQEDWDEIPDQEKKEGIQLLHKTSIQTYQLLEDLLDWGKTQEGLISASKSKFALSELINEVQNIFHLNLKDKEILLVQHLPSELQLNTDKKLLSQILQNLVGNAIKYSHPKSKIDISVEDEAHQTKICITDYGIGIPEDKIEALFSLDKYFNRPGTQNEKSTGMGLILCKEYAKILDAEIKVKSKVDAGSSFCLILPKPSFENIQLI